MPQTCSYDTECLDSFSRLMLMSHVCWDDSAESLDELDGRSLTVHYI